MALSPSPNTSDHQREAKKLLTKWRRDALLADRPAAQSALRSLVSRGCDEWLLMLCVSIIRGARSRPQGKANALLRGTNLAVDSERNHLLKLAKTAAVRCPESVVGWLEQLREHWLEEISICHCGGALFDAVARAALDSHVRANTGEGHAVNVAELIDAGLGRAPSRPYSAEAHEKWRHRVRRRFSFYDDPEDLGSELEQLFSTEEEDKIARVVKRERGENLSSGGIARLREEILVIPLSRCY
jgi:hypothetical protein